MVRGPIIGRSNKYLSSSKLTQLVWCQPTLYPKVSIGYMPTSKSTTALICPPPQCNSKVKNFERRVDIRVADCEVAY